jgi:hypothetical protein
VQASPVAVVTEGSRKFEPSSTLLWTCLLAELQWQQLHHTNGGENKRLLISGLQCWKFLVNVHRILLWMYADGLFIGDAETSQDPEFLELNKISNLVNLAGREVANVWASHGLVYLNYNWEDRPGKAAGDCEFKLSRSLFLFQCRFQVVR